jgi:RNA-directed DNA polymerase
MVGLQPKADAEPWLNDRRERCHRCHRARHPDQTRLREGGRWASARRQRRGQGKPESVDWLGLTPMGSQTRTGTWTVRRQTGAQRLRTQWQEIKQTLRERRHGPRRQRGAWRKRVLTGPDRYEGVPRHMRRRRVVRDPILR